MDSYVTPSFQQSHNHFLEYNPSRLHQNQTQKQPAFLQSIYIPSTPHTTAMSLSPCSQHRRASTWMASRVWVVLEVQLSNIITHHLLPAILGHMVHCRHSNSNHIQFSSSLPEHAQQGRVLCDQPSTTGAPECRKYLGLSSWKRLLPHPCLMC